MATAPVSRKLNLTRDQLAQFLTDQQQIRQFELLFSTVDAIAPDVVNEVKIEAGSAQATANEALAELARLADAVELLTAAPVIENNNSVVTDYIDFNTTTPVPALKVGRMHWNGGYTLNLEMTPNVNQAIGESQYYYLKATATITKGQLVMFDGGVGSSGVIQGKPATGVTNGQYIMGIAAENIANNAFGLVASFGVVRGFDTTGTPYGEVWADGDILYYNPSYVGGLTKNLPPAPTPHVVVAAVVNAGPAGSGSVFVRVQAEPLVSQLSDVFISGIANGDLLQYDSVQQRWENVPASTLPVGTATNLAGGATGSVPYQSASSNTAMLPIGTALQVLKVNAGATAPQWVSGAALTKTDDTNVTLTLGGTPATSLLAATSLTLGWTGQLGLTRGGTNASLTASAGSVAYSTASALALNTAGSSGDWLKSAGTAAPTWTAPAALTKTDDTNVTLTLGGSASTALLNAASLTLGWTGQLATTRGGTGTATTFTAGSVVFAGASGVYSQDNANFFWDDTNNRLGLGNVAPACALDVTGGIQTSRTGVTSPATTDGNIFSGTYTPQQLSIGGIAQNTNVDAVTYQLAQYMRVGNMVTVSGRVDIDATATGNTIVQFSVPIASNFSSTAQGAGTAAFTSATVANNSFARLSAQTTDDCIFLQCNSTNTASVSWFYNFTYRII
jgi:hypothetical protein